MLKFKDSKQSQGSNGQSSCKLRQWFVVKILQKILSLRKLVVEKFPSLQQKFGAENFQI
jgi:hypothetical protein